MQQKHVYGFIASVLIGTLGGLIGLGGAEFRLPLLIGLFAFPALDAVILNKAMSLVVVASALPFRASTVSWQAIAENWLVIINVLAISLPTMLVSFARYSRDSSFSVLGANRSFLFIMAAGSLFGTWIGGMLLGIVSESVLIPLLVLLLVLSAIKVWKHK